jgi:hypothetical protein
MEGLTALVAALANIVLRLLGRRRPKLVVKVRPTGGSSGKIDFTASVSNVGTAPALDCVLRVEVQGVGESYTSQPFSLAPNTLNHPVRFSLDRPRLGDLVPALTHATTLYGRRLTVRVRYGRREARCHWDEARYDPVTDAARHQTQQEAWRRGLGIDETSAGGS